MRLVHDPNEILWYAMSSPFRRGDESQGSFGCSPYREFYPDEEKTGDSGR